MLHFELEGEEEQGVGNRLLERRHVEDKAVRACDPNNRQVAHVELRVGRGRHCRFLRPRDVKREQVRERALDGFRELVLVRLLHGRRALNDLAKHLQQAEVVVKRGVVVHGVGEIGGHRLGGEREHGHFRRRVRGHRKVLAVGHAEGDTEGVDFFLAAPVVGAFLGGQAPGLGDHGDGLDDEGQGRRADPVVAHRDHALEPAVRRLGPAAARRHLGRGPGGRGFPGVVAVFVGGRVGREHVCARRLAFLEGAHRFDKGHLVAAECVRLGAGTD